MGETYYALDALSWVPGQIKQTTSINADRRYRRALEYLGEALRRVVMTPDIEAAAEETLSALGALYEIYDQMLPPTDAVEAGKAFALERLEHLRALIEKGKRSDYDREHRPPGPDFAE